MLFIKVQTILLNRNDLAIHSEVDARMNDVLRITVATLGIIFATTNGYLLLKRKVNERISVIWIFILCLIFVVAAFPSLLNRVAYSLGVSYPPSLLYLVALLGMTSMLMYQSIQLTVLEQRLKQVSQVVAIIEARQELILPLTRIHELESAVAVDKEYS